MVIQCVVFGCSNRQGKKGVSFYRFPLNKRKRKAWVKAVNRANWMPNAYSRICSEHFIGGWHSDDVNDENFRPTLFAYKIKEMVRNDVERIERFEKRSLRQEMNEVEMKEKTTLQRHHNFSVYCHSYSGNVGAPELAVEPGCTDSDLDDTDIKTFKDEGVQCDMDPLLKENLDLRKEVTDLKNQLKKHKWTVEKILDDDSKTRFYTGLPSFAVFMWLFNLLQCKAERMRFWVGSSTDQTVDRKRSSSGSLQLIDQLFAVLMRLRLGIFTTDISERFQISEGTFSKYFSTWVSLLWHELKFINPFPSRDIVNRTMPPSFKAKFPTVRIILDCTEIFIQRSSSLVHQSLTFSNYKHHTTIKFLVGITPSGVISFVSEGWPGKTSDRELTMQSGILDLLDENDSVMADKGFTIRDVLENKKCKLNIPPFKGACPQFSPEEVHETQEIASLRIHVERSIGRVKNFHILDGVMPLTLQPLSTKIFQLVCWLTNLDVPLVNN